MLFMAVLVLMLLCCLPLATKLSPYTERLMRYIWEDPTDKLKVKIARRVKELCIDGDVPKETAAMMIAKENNIMEEQVRDLMSNAAADPVIMRMAFGSKVGGFLHKYIKRFGAMGGQ